MPTEEAAPEAAPEQQQPTFTDRVVQKLQVRLGSRDVEIASLQTQLEIVADERDYFLKGLRDNGLIQEPGGEAPVAEVEEVPSDEVDVLEPV